MNGRNHDSGIWAAIIFVFAIWLCFSVLPAQAAGMLTPVDGSVPPQDIRHHPIKTGTAM